MPPFIDRLLRMARRVLVFLALFFFFFFFVSIAPFPLLSLSLPLSVRLIKLAVRRWLFSLFSSSTVWITLIFPTRPLSRLYVQTTIQSEGATGMRDKRRG
jgi:hypothetical protein